MEEAARHLRHLKWLAIAVVVVALVVVLDRSDRAGTAKFNRDYCAAAAYDCVDGHPR